MAQVNGELERLAAPRLRKRERTRRSLIETAIRLISEKGIEATSVLDVTSALGMTNGSFYYHFSSKEDLLEVIGHDIITELNDVITSRAADDPAHIIGRGPLIVLQYMDLHPQLRAILVHVIEDVDRRHEDLSDRLASLLSWGSRVGRFVVDDLEVVTRFCRGIVGAAARLRLQGDADPHLGAMAALNTLRMLGLSHEEAAAIVASEQAHLKGV